MSNLNIKVVSNYLHFKEQYNEIVNKIIQIRKELHFSQDSIADWCETNRLRVLNFEKKEEIDMELLLILCDKLSILLHLYHEIN